MDKSEHVLIVRAKDGDKEAQLSLVNSNKGLVVGEVNKYCKDKSIFDDCIVEGQIGILNAIKQYDTSKDTPFWIFAKPYVDKAIRDYLYPNSNKSVAKKYKLFTSMMDEFYQEYERTPDYEELADYIEQNGKGVFNPDEIQACLENYVNQFSHSTFDYDIDSETQNVETHNVNYKKERTSVSKDKQLGKAEAMIKIIILLSDGRVHTVEDIAEYAQTTKRNVLAYKNDITRIGYPLESIRGKGNSHGYRIRKNILFPVTYLTAGEFDAIRNAKNYVDQNKSFIWKDEADSAFRKIFLSSKTDEKEKNELLEVSYHSAQQMDEKKIKYRYERLKRSLKEKRELIIEYDFIKIPRQKVTFHVYNIYLSNNNYYFDGFNVEANDIYYGLQLSRIIQILGTDNHYEIDERYKQKRDEDEIQKQKGNIPITVTFIVRGESARYIRGYKFSDDQIIEELDDDVLKVTTTFKNHYSMFRTLTSYGTNCEVLEPKEAIDSLLEFADYIKNQYK